jgi:hypothetical protein
MKLPVIYASMLGTKNVMVLLHSKTVWYYELYMQAFLCVTVHYVIIKTFNTRNILNYKIEILSLWQHVSIQGTIFRPSLYVIHSFIHLFVQ